MKKNLKISIVLFSLAILGWVVFNLLFKKPEVVELVSADLAFVNAKILTMDERFNLYESGYLIVRDSEILDLGPGTLPKKYLVKKIIDAQGKVLMPGLINTHSHSAMSLLSGVGEGMKLESWLKAMNVYESSLNAEDVYIGSLSAQIKMVESGTTSFNDMYMFPEKAVEAAEMSGLRAVIRVPIQQDEYGLTFNEDIIKKYGENSLVTFSLSPNPLLDFTLDQLKEVSDYASKNNYLVHIHFEEDNKARKDSLFKFGLSPLEFISQAGLLKNKLVLAHAADLTKEEIGIISQASGAGVSFNPISEQRLFTPLTPVKQMGEVGLTVALGTDGEASSDLDLFAQINEAVTKTAVSPKEAIKMATINGAKLLGLENKIGSLEIGKQADIILVEVSNSDDVYKSLVYSTTGENVVYVIVAGRVLLEDKKIVNTNIDQVKINQQVEEVRNRLGIK